MVHLYYGILCNYLKLYLLMGRISMSEVGKKHTKNPCVHHIKLACMHMYTPRHMQCTHYGRKYSKMLILVIYQF